MAKDSVAEDVEHVVPIIGKCEWVDDSIELDDKLCC